MNRIAGLLVVALDLSELAKAEGAVTCCSLVYKKNETPCRMLRRVYGGTGTETFSARVRTY